MKKALVLSLVMLMVMSLSAFATSTRTLTLGDNNNVLLDDNNIWLYPSRVYQYPNIAVGEFTRDSYLANNNYFYNFGVNWKFGEKKPWVLGTYFSTAPDAVPSIYDIDNPMGNPIPGFQELFYYYYDYATNGAASVGPDPTYSNRRMDLLYGRKFGTTTFGFSFGYLRSSWKSDVANDQSEEKFGQYKFGFGLTPDAGNWDVAAQIWIGSFSQKNTTGVETIKPDGYTDFALYGRLFHKYNNQITFVPHAGFTFGTHGVKYPTGLYTEVKSTNFRFDIGSGMNYTPVNNVMGVLDFGIQYNKVKDEPAAGNAVEYTKWFFPYWKLGVEGEVFNWMTLRLGAVSNWEIWKLKDQYTWKDVEANSYLGVGLNFNRLHIDTYTDPQIILDGFNFISGSTNADRLNFQVSVLYDMF